MDQGAAWTPPPSVPGADPATAPRVAPGAPSGAGGARGGGPAGDRRARPSAAEPIRLPGDPGFGLVLRRYEVPVAGWGDRPPLTVCLVADLHASEPSMPLARVEAIVEAANALRPDLHAFLGDLPGHFLVPGQRRVDPAAAARALAGLRAPLGTFAVLGNHDWWDDVRAQRTRRGPPAMRGILEAAGLRVLANEAARLPHGPGGVWLLGTDSAEPFFPANRKKRGAEDLDAALAMVADDAPAILLAHEPDPFARLPPRVAAQLSGHTHGGQVALRGWTPAVASRYGSRYAHGLLREDDGRTLVVSAGLGCTMVPVRFGVPPELVLVTLSGGEGVG